MNLPRGWTDETNPCIFARTCESEIFAEKSVAWVNRLCIAVLRYRQNLFGLEITLRRRRGPDPKRFIRHREMHRMRISIGIDRHGFDSKFAQGANHATRDFASVSDQDFCDHDAWHSVRLFILGYGS